MSDTIGRTCVENATLDPCAIPIRHLVAPTDPGSSYGQMSDGDLYLDWWGREDEQGAYEDRLPAAGTPLMWTTDKSVMTSFTGTAKKAFLRLPT